MKDFEQSELECECGSKHSIGKTEIIVGPNGFECLLTRLCQLDFKKILVFYGLDDNSLLEMIKKEEGLSDKELSFIILPNLLQTTSLADRIEDKGQDLILVIGGENIISFAKYYAYSFETPLYIFPVGQFLDFTFSKYARLFDGITYNFYNTLSPCGVFVDTTLNTYNEYQTYYLSSKLIAVFDNQVAGLVYNCKFCPRMVDFIKSSMEKYLRRLSVNNNENNLNNIWTLIRFGQAMTFFNQTKFFFGADHGLVELLTSYKPSCDFLELETIALKLVINSYDCFLQDSNFFSDHNLNKHINHISWLLKIPSSQTIKKLASSEVVTPTKETLNLFGSYQPYLYGCFKNLAAQIFKIQSRLELKENVLKKYKLNSKDIELCFALCVDMFDRPTLLHIVGGFGYLDKLF